MKRAFTLIAIITIMLFVLSVSAFSEQPPMEFVSNLMTDGTPVGEQQTVSYIAYVGTRNSVEGTIHSYKRQDLNNGYVRFTLKYTMPINTDIVLFGEDDMFVYPDTKTTSEQGTFQFDVSKANLNRVNYLWVRFVPENYVNYEDYQFTNEGLLIGICHPGTGHTLTAHQKIEPSCTEAGAEAYWSCDVCKALFSDEEGKNEIEKPVEIAAYGHTEVIDSAIQPTCTTTGLTEGKHCSVCGTVLVAQEVIPSIEHTMVNGKCSVCGYTEAPKEEQTVKPAVSTTATPKPVPKTGDNAPLALWIVLILAGLIALGGVFVWKSKIK